MKPIRIQRSRKKGSKLVSPNGLPVVCVTRPGRWGNPYDSADAFSFELGVVRNELDAEPGKYYFSDIKRHMKSIVENIAELRGKNLACWCKPSDSCHADILLEIANGDGAFSPTPTEGEAK